MKHKFCDLGIGRTVKIDNIDYEIKQLYRETESNIGRKDLSTRVLEIKLVSKDGTTKIIPENEAFKYFEF